MSQNSKQEVALILDQILDKNMSIESLPRLQVPDLNVEDVDSKNLQRQETVETLFENRDEPVTYGTMTEELAEVSEGRSLAESDTPSSEAPPGVGGRVPGCA